MYTYILKDKELGIYKIGRSTDPIKRFKSLCISDDIFPIALIPEDVEQDLHKMFKENRTVHAGFNHNGGTEWFKRGGRFNEFIDEIDDGTVIPHISIHNAIASYIKRGIIRFINGQVAAEVEEIDFGYHTLGTTLLSALKIIKVQKYHIDVLERLKDDVLTIGKKITISKKLIANIEKYYVFYVGYNKLSLTMHEDFDKDKYNSKIVKIVLDSKGIFPPFYIMINRIK